MNLRRFFAELKRRNVYKVAIAYGVVAWLLMQIASQIFTFFEIPNWAVRLVVLLLIIGLLFSDRSFGSRHPERFILGFWWWANARATHEKVRLPALPPPDARAVPGLSGAESSAGADLR